VLHKISQRVIRQLRKRGYLEAGTEDVVPTGYDPVREDDPEFARTMAASVQQRIAFGERAGQPVRRIGSGFGYEGERPTLTSTRCASVHGFSLHANTLVPAHRRDQLERLLRYTARGSSAWSAMPTATSSTPSPAPGLMAPRGSNSLRWSSSRSSQRSCSCRVCTWCGTRGV
jgi:hypothetical protein